MSGRARKWSALLLVVCMLLGITACGIREDETQENSTVYVPEFVDFDLSELGVEYINTGCCDGTYVYILAEVNEEVEETDPVTGEVYTNFEYRTAILRLTLDSGEVVELENYTPGNQGEKQPDRESYFYIENLSIGSDGTLWVTESLEEYIYDVPENFDPETDYMWNYEMLEQRIHTAPPPFLR